MSGSDGRQSADRRAAPIDALPVEFAAAQLPDPPGMSVRPAGILRKLARWLGSACVTAALVLIRSYQAWVRPNLVGSCKFCPSCSDYAAEALQLHGVWRGGRLAVRRLARCHPFSAGGIDPVPAP